MPSRVSTSTSSHRNALRTTRHTKASTRHTPYDHFSQRLGAKPAQLDTTVKALRSWAPKRAQDALHPCTPPAPQAARQVAQRAQKAITLASAIRDMLHHTPPAGACQPAWAMLTSIVCHSLTYNSRVMPCSLVLPHARAVETAMLQTLHAIIGIQPASLSPLQLTHIGLPTRCGGLEVHLPTRTCVLARAASLVEHGPTLRAALRARNPALDATTLDGVAAALEEGLGASLEHLGIHGLGPEGSPLPEPTDLPPSEQFRPHVPLRHLQSHYQLHVATHTHRSILASATAHDAICIRSAGGHAAGTSLTAPLQYGGAHFPGQRLQVAAALAARNLRPASLLLHELERLPRGALRTPACT